ncbi:39S mitochondrial ribosomal protein L46-domain-containing protein [Podospora didyma]|uniref:Large ribosomal subunit protein mL46 n=1 Tax=Podospora didyma TaxID=330526 RepID=A0AAE0K185_9PEZI|nr:39S mitochondrial ribosomal protein L46-domain-containing protein [Podospora didyma]
MSAPSRGANALSALLRNSSPRKVCYQCRTTQSSSTSSSYLPLSARRFYAEAAVASSTASNGPATMTSSSISSNHVPPLPLSLSESLSTPTPSTSTATRYRIKSGIILTRPPLLTRELTSFESSFFLYQKRLNERLVAPFRPGFYFKTDTSSEMDWKLKLKERHGVPAKDIGRYNPRGRMGWNDEVLVNSRTSSQEELTEKLLHDAEVRISEDGEIIADDERMPVERPMPRRTEADKQGDVRRLDRALDRTLYLVVLQQKDGEAVPTWRFPSGFVGTDEAIHQTAARVLEESAGVNMNTWVVGRVPVAHHITEVELGKDGTSIVKRGEKTFFLKGRIMAGQADLTGNKHGLVDFKWLTQEELLEVLPRSYYNSVRNMFGRR